MKRAVALFSAVLLLLLCGCKGGKTNSDSRINVVTTVFPIYDLVRAVAGDKADISMLISPGTEVHSFDPSPSDMKAVYKSDAFFYIGGESDKWVDTVAEDISEPTALIECVEHSHEAEHGHGHAHTDEHIWTSPAVAVKMVERITERLVAVDSENEEYYRQNSQDYIARIEDAAKRISTVVKKQNEPFVLVADRNPYTYFFEEFEIEYIAALDGCANSADISLNTMSRLIAAVKEKNLKCAYYTELSNKKIASVLAQETGIVLYQLNSVHNVSVDEFEAGMTYVDLMYANAEALEKGWEK